ncbi:hypothetical protein J4474_01235 [Candidatus Pacearchaeota archaeon]|nr:hypothetical protein [Candidatus Pacearchaeota archaeon]
MKSTDLLMFVAVVAVLLATMNLVITINKIGDFKIFSGFVTDTGIANLTITSNTQVNFSYDDFINWGSGYVPTATDNCELTTTGIMNCTGFSTISDGFVIVNIGNEDVNLNLTSSKSAADFIGAGAVFQWNVSQNETGSCPSGLDIASWTTVSTTGVRACDNFTFLDNRDELEIHLRIVIPNTAATDAKTVTITADAQTYI